MSSQTASNSQTASKRFGLHRIIALLMVALLGGALLTGCNVTAEQNELTAINQLRASHGVPALVRSVELDRKATGQAVRMARRSQIFHSTSLEAGVTPGYTLLGENVGMGGSMPAVQQALVDSPLHLRNMLDSRFTEIGIGSVVRDGRTYLVQFFVGR